MIGSYTPVYIYNAGYHCQDCARRDYATGKFGPPLPDTAFDEAVGQSLLKDSEDNLVTSYPDVLLEGMECNDPTCPEANAEITDEGVTYEGHSHPERCETCEKEL